MTKNIIRIALVYVLFALTAIFLFSGCMYKVTLKSDPAGATVKDLELGELGQTPVYLDVDRDASLHLTFSKPGFESVKKDELLIKQNRTVMVTLKTYATLLFIESIPPGASLRVYDVTNGVEVPLENPTKINTEIFYTNRRHEIPNTLSEADIVLEKKGYNILKKRIKLEPNIENRFQFQMEPLSAKLSITSTPTGAEIYDRNRGFLGRTPLNCDFTWEQLSSFSRLKDAFDLDEIDLQLTIRKQGYHAKEVMHKLYIYRNNPELIVELHPIAR